MTGRILFVYNTPQRFVLLDRDLLRLGWSVHERYVRKPSFSLAQLAKEVQAADLVYCWFASWHSLLPVLLARLYKKPAVVTVGGYDTASVPEAHYGSQRGGLRRFIVQTILKRSTHLLTFSNSAKQEAIANASVPESKISVIYLGVQPIPAAQTARQAGLVLTVGGVWQENLLRKGLLPFTQAAALLPDMQFILAGKWYDHSIETLRQSAGSNVEFAGFVDDARLAELYNRAGIYVQASLHEGFGASAAEAMSAGCIPVVTRAGSLPEVVGNAGIYARSNSPADIASAIVEAQQLPDSFRRLARERIVNEFPVEKRRAALHSYIAAAMKAPQPPTDPQ